VTNVRNMCKRCWQEIHKAGPDEKPPNLVISPSFSPYWCGRCGRPSFDYVKGTCPDGVMWVALEQPT